jgi:2-polyprenyl-6-methoxyphenol hydroxylase-like FAD-dependent oxidoreductase
VGTTSEDVPVLIVGASLVGLSTAVFLGWHGVPLLVVERHGVWTNLGLPSIQNL